MIVGTVTYENIVNVVKNWVKTNCTNITNFAGIPAVFKSGYTTTVQYAGDATSPSKYTTAISGNAVASVASSTVDTDMTNFLISVGVSNISSKIPDAEFLDFMKNMVVFCSTKISYVTSQYSTNKYLIYDTTHTTYNYNVEISDEAQKRLVYAQDVLDLLTSVITVTKQNMRNRSCIYKITMHT